MSTPYRRFVAGAVAASVLLRARSLWLPLSVDEAGALVVARAWSGGHRLYHDVFIDRPQAMVAVFGQWDRWFGAGSLRLLAIAAGATMVVGAASIARTIGGSWRAGALAAWITAITAASPAIEGYTANGELLAAGLTVPAMAIAASAITGRRPTWHLLAAGALAAGGVAVKQSGSDVLISVLVWLAAAAWWRWRPRRAIAAQAGLVLAGAALVLIPLAVDGAARGWDAYAYALYGFRVHARSVGAGGQWARLVLTTAIAATLFGPAVLLAVRHLGALGASPRRSWASGRLRPEHALVGTWLGVATIGFAVGGNYHRHYWVGLAAPIAVSVAVALASGAPDAADPDGATLRPLLVRALWLPVAISLVLVAAPRLERDRRIDADAALASWVEAHRDDPGDQLLVLCASVTFYADAHQTPPLRYLWVDHVRSGRGGPQEVVELLDGPHRPRYVALHQPPRRCDPTGAVQRTLDRRYRPAGRVHGVPVLEAWP